MSQPTTAGGDSREWTCKLESVRAENSAKVQSPSSRAAAYRRIPGRESLHANVIWCKTGLSRNFLLVYWWMVSHVCNFKRIVSRDDYFFNVLKIETVLPNERLWFSQFLVVFLWRKFIMKFLLLLWNHLLIIKFLPVTLFSELVSTFWYPPVSLKMFRNPPLILKIVPKAGYECKLEKIFSQSL